MVNSFLDSYSVKPLKEFCLSVVDLELMPTALRVALVVGSVLFVINHGSAILQRQMNRERWISGGLTYIVPYLVNIHGQYTIRSRQRARRGKADSNRNSG
ncbi:nitrate/nitrite transporter NrtS [Moorena sp. SIO1F2]|uniref:nitrate/nitrite transporter NrtS n=1 Tax=Moorena sp. SIO1F2 TaxID=2607819 RepID=UPI0025D8DF8E|nr:nitrate/nitrite transporter NrtS [Moorena sp. SIO1F2]